MSGEWGRCPTCRRPTFHGFQCGDCVREELGVRLPFEVSQVASALRPVSVLNALPYLAHGLNSRQPTSELTSSLIMPLGPNAYKPPRGGSKLRMQRPG